MDTATAYKFQRGLSLMEMVVGMGLTALVALGLSDLDKSQGKAAKGMSFRMDSEVLALSGQKVMADENSCTATILALGSSPDMTSTIVLPSLSKTYFSGGAWKNNIILERGKTYGPVILSNIRVRPFNSSRDEIPGHKLELEFTRKGEGLGAEKIVKTSPFFFDDQPAPSSPGVNFRCSSVPRVDAKSQLKSSPRTLIGCPSSRQVTVNCPPHTRMLSCGIIDQQATGDEDKVSCYRHPAGDKCIFSHELSGGCDTIYGECYCL